MHYSNVAQVPLSVPFRHINLELLLENLDSSCQVLCIPTIGKIIYIDTTVHQMLGIFVYVLLIVNLLINVKINKVLEKTRLANRFQE